jgi:hypothetical protein
MEETGGEMTMERQVWLTVPSEEESEMEKSLMCATKWKQSLRRESLWDSNSVTKESLFAVANSIRPANVIRCIQ